MGKTEISPDNKSAIPESGNNKFSFYYAPRSERYEMGKQMRKKCPRSSHAKWKSPANRPDPVDLIIESNKGSYS